MGTQLVVFDMAGTTVEDKDNVHDALIQAFKHFDYTIGREEANKVMGYPKPIAIHQILKYEFGVSENANSLTEKIHEVFVREMVSFYESDYSVKAKRGAAETFCTLREKGIKVALDTGFSRDIADTIITRLGWQKDNLIDFSVTSDEVPHGRPHPDMIFRAMHLAGVISANEVAKIGDTVSDLQEGTAAGCKYVIGITSGAYTRSQLEKERHTHLINELREVINIVV